MSLQIALDEESNDIIKLESGGIARVQDGRYTVQLVKNKLMTLLHEWRLNPALGWINFDDYQRNPDLFGIEMRARKIILSCKGVQTIDSISVKLTQRTLYLNFQATTVYGKIDLEVPWRM